MTTQSVTAVRCVNREPAPREHHSTVMTITLAQQIPVIPRADVSMRMLQTARAVTTTTPALNQTPVNRERAQDQIRSLALPLIHVMTKALVIR